MPDLNETVLPVVWSIARLTLLDTPAKSLDELVERLTPAGLIERSGGAGTSRHVRPSVRMLEQLGVIAQNGADGVTLAEPTLDDAGFRLAVATRLLSVPGDDVWLLRSDGAQLEHHAQAAVAWLCLQGVETGISGWASGGSDLLTQQFGVDRPLLRDTAPYNTLERLVVWLGLGGFVAGSSQSLLVPDPTALVRAALDDIVAAGTAVAMTEILQRSAVRFPWLPHGSVGRAVADRMRVTPPDDSGEHGRCPQCLSLALVRLELDGAIELEEGDDPHERVLLSLTLDESKPVARVIRS